MHSASSAALLLFCSLYLNWKFETLFFCWGWIVLNLFLNFEQKCSYNIVLIKKISVSPNSHPSPISSGEIITLLVSIRFFHVLATSPGEIKLKILCHPLKLFFCIRGWKHSSNFTNKIPLLYSLLWYSLRHSSSCIKLVFKCMRLLCSNTTLYSQSAML